MPNITKRTNKDGSLSYKITVTKGRDANGKQIRHFMTFSPAPNMTEKKAEKEAQRVAFAFEKQIEDGFSLDNRQTFSQYAAYVLDLKQRSGVKYKTIEYYRQLMERINPAIGHIKLADIKPQHLNAFYKNLAEEGIRKGADRAQTKVDLPALFKEKGVTRAHVAALAEVAPMTVTTAAQGKKISLERAQIISNALGYQVNELFSIEKSNVPIPSFPEGLYFVAFRCTQKNRGFVRVSGGKISKTFFYLLRWTRKQTKSWPLRWQRFPAGSCRLRTVEAGAAGWQSNVRRRLGYERSVLPNHPPRHIRRKHRTPRPRSRWRRRSSNGSDGVRPARAPPCGCR